MNDEYGSSETSPDYSQTPPPERQYAHLTIRSAVEKPLVTYIILSITILMFILQILSQFLLGTDIPAALGMKFNEYILAGQLWRLLTPVVLHASLIHIAFNMYALFIFGRGLERHYGYLRFLILYLLSAYAGNVFSFLLSPNPSLGASTAVFGLVAAEGIFIYRNRFLFGKNARSMLMNIGTIVAINLVLGLSPGIDNWGHLGGLVGGLLFAWFAGPALKLEGSFPVFTTKENPNSTRTLISAAVIILVISLLAYSKFWLA